MCSCGLLISNNLFIGFKSLSLPVLSLKDRHKINIQNKHNLGVKQNKMQIIKLISQIPQKSVVI